MTIEQDFETVQDTLQGWRNHTLQATNALAALSRIEDSWKGLYQQADLQGQRGDLLKKALREVLDETEAERDALQAQMKLATEQVEWLQRTKKALKAALEKIADGTPGLNWAVDLAHQALEEVKK
jgi:chromosome segregation ATPase